jgi:hypothetical protein
LNNPLKYTDPTGEWVHIIVGGIVGGLMNLASNAGNISNFGEGYACFFIGFGIGAATTATGGAAGAIGGFIFGAATGFSAGFVYGTTNSWLAGGDVRTNLLQGLRSGLWGGVSGGVTGGLVGGFRAKSMGLDFWDGTGWRISEMKGVSIAPDAEFTGLEAKPYQDIKETARKYYPNDYKYATEIGTGPWNKQMKNMGYTMDATGTKMLDPSGQPIQGFCMSGKNNAFDKLQNYIAISPNMVTHVNTFKAVVGHELIHAFHFSTGLYVGENWSEYYAYTYSVTIPSPLHSSETLMLNYYKMLQLGTKINLNNYPLDIRTWMSNFYPY